jgi:hypothetical protein
MPMMTLPALLLAPMLATWLLSALIPAAAVDLLLPLNYVVDG